MCMIQFVIITLQLRTLEHLVFIHVHEVLRTHSKRLLWIRVGAPFVIRDLDLYQDRHMRISIYPFEKLSIQFKTTNYINIHRNNSVRLVAMYFTFSCVTTQNQNEDDLNKIAEASER